MGILRYLFTLSICFPPLCCLDQHHVFLCVTIVSITSTVIAAFPFLQVPLTIHVYTRSTLIHFNFFFFFFFFFKLNLIFAAGVKCLLLALPVSTTNLLRLISTSKSFLTSGGLILFHITKTTLVKVFLILLTECSSHRRIPARRSSILVSRPYFGGISLSTQVSSPNKPILVTPPVRWQGWQWYLSTHLGFVLHVAGVHILFCFFKSSHKHWHFRETTRRKPPGHVEKIQTTPSIRALGSHQRFIEGNTKE
ncbi:hypothetical protein Mapa_015729 [Marchantia paleacea]|nr:hypothetical protein Mapa_015729 [Marchantia paleacea]